MLGFSHALQGNISIFFFLQQFKTLSKHKFSNLRPLLYITLSPGFQISKKCADCTSRSDTHKLDYIVYKSGFGDREFFQICDVFL